MDLLSSIVGGFGSGTPIHGDMEGLDTEDGCSKPTKELVLPTLVSYLTLFKFNPVLNMKTRLINPCHVSRVLRLYLIVMLN
jgi:hypothetical protein